MSKLDEAAEKAQESRDTICSVKCDGCYIDGYRAGFMKAIDIVRARYDRLKASNIQEYEGVESTLSELEIFKHEPKQYAGYETIDISAVPIKNFAGEK